MSSPQAFLLSSPLRGTSPRKPVTLSSSPDLPSVAYIASQTLQRSSSTINNARKNKGRLNQTQSARSPIKERPAASPPKFKPPASKSSIQNDQIQVQSRGDKRYKLGKVEKNVVPLTPGHIGIGVKVVEDEIVQLQPAVSDMVPANSIALPLDIDAEDDEKRVSRKTTKAQPQVFEPLNLEMASTRRTDWTPPQSKGKSVIDLASSGSQCSPLQSFSGLLEAYHHTNDVTPAAEAGSEDIFGKRKRIDCVTTGITTSTNSTAVAEKSPAKGNIAKKKKKKPLTLTELATAAYRSPSPTPAIVAAFEAPEALPLKTPVDPNPTDNKTTGKRKAQPRKKVSKPTKKKKKPVALDRILLSPNAALQQVARQEIIFGTSSQLAGNHSPTFLRDLAAAMRLSNQIDEGRFQTPINSDAIEPPEQRLSLWEAAARDTEGELFDLQITEIRECVADNHTLKSVDDPFGYVTVPDDTKADDSFVNLSDVLEPREPEEEQKAGVCSPNPQKTPAEEPVTSQITVPSSPPAARSPSANEIEDTRPNYETFTDSQLCQAVASYGFKEIKKRTTQIALLDRCWQSQATVKLGTRSQAFSTLSGRQGARLNPCTPIRPSINSHASVGNTSEHQEPPPSAQQPPPSAQQPIETPKRGRGRPRKVASTATATTTTTIKESKRGKSTIEKPMPTTPKRSKHKVIEIPDSESEQELGFSASPSLSPEPTFSPPGAIDLSISVDEDTEISLCTMPPDENSTLFDVITMAVTSAPRSTDPVNPSWHEKIVMYDPIVIEDLATWLNTGQLTKAGFDDEVSGSDVKRWCEANSICCVWKVNLRGDQRKRL